MFTILGRLALMALCSAPLAAGTIDITDNLFAAVHHGEELSIHFGVWNYGLNNPDFSPYPTRVGLMVLGREVHGYALATIPDTTIQYFPRFLFEGSLESLDGSISVPFYDPNAARLGLPQGSLLVTPVSLATSGEPAAPVLAIDAFQSFDLATSLALFGSHIGSYDDAAVIRLRNQGASFHIGPGPGWTVGSSISEPGIRGLGPVETAGITGRVVVSDSPEPATWLMLAGGLILLGWAARRFRSR